MDAKSVLGYLANVVLISTGCTTTATRHIPLPTSSPPVPAAVATTVLAPPAPQAPAATIVASRVSDPRTLLTQFMAARFHHDALLACAFTTAVVCPPTGATIDVTELTPPSNPCWYRYEVVSFRQTSPAAASVVVRIYEHQWGGDVAGGPPRSWEQDIGLADTPQGWKVDVLGPRRNQQEEATEPHGPTTSACITPSPGAHLLANDHPSALAAQPAATPSMTAASVSISQFDGSGTLNRF